MIKVSFIVSLTVLVNKKKWSLCGANGPNAMKENAMGRCAVTPGSGGLRRVGYLPVGASTYLASSYILDRISIYDHFDRFPRVEGSRKEVIGGRKKLTWPAMEPSWADLPLTVKVTPLGALDLTSRLAKEAC